MPHRDPQLYVHRDSSPWVVYLQVLFTKQPVVGFQFGGVHGYRDTYGRWVLEMHDLIWRADGYEVRMLESDGTLHKYAVAIKR